MQLPVAEAMVTYKEEKSSGEESSQVFLPFLSDVRVGSDVISGNFRHSLPFPGFWSQTTQVSSLTHIFTVFLY